MDRSDIRTRVRYNLRETTASVWTDAELNAHIDQAQRYVASQLSDRYLPKLLKKDTDTVSLPTVIYNLAADFMRMASDVDVGGTNFPLVSPQEGKVTLNYGANHIFSAKTVSWVLDDDLYFSTLDNFDGETITWYYMKWPDDLSTDGTASEIQDSVIDLVIDYASARALVKTDPARSLDIEKRVDQRISLLNER